MIKVPATPAGIPAIEQLIGDGICVNVTLMFALETYDAVADAYLRGLERRAAEGKVNQGTGKRGEHLRQPRGHEN
ncbi:MAG: transaldolase family protein [Pyrinomonadaceae bacterium]